MDNDRMILHIKIRNPLKCLYKFYFTYNFDKLFTTYEDCFDHIYYEFRANGGKK